MTENIINVYLNLFIHSCFIIKAIECYIKAYSRGDALTNIGVSVSRDLVELFLLKWVLQYVPSENLPDDPFKKLSDFFYSGCQIIKLFWKLDFFKFCFNGFFLKVLGLMNSMETSVFKKKSPWPLKVTIKVKSCPIGPFQYLTALNQILLNFCVNIINLEDFLMWKMVLH